MKKSRLFLISFLIVALSVLTGWRSHRHHKKHRVLEPSVIEESQPKKLDLSLPMQIEEKSTTHITQTNPNILVEKPKKIQRKVELEADAIAFPFPESEKSKDVDGAGIRLNIKP